MKGKRRHEIIPVTTAEEYQKRMHALDLRSELFLYQGQPHGFFNIKNKEYFMKTVIEMERFLASLGYLKGEPTLQE